jgi:CNP1-like family protein
VKSDWELKNQALVDKEQGDAVPPSPAFPAPASLLGFEVPGLRELRYFIDGATLGVDEKGVVRYVLVARSPGGAENVTFEAIRCKSGEYRVYALGRADGTWGGRAGAWQSIAASRQPHHRTLHREYFCPQSNPISDADDGRRALQQGGHPWAKGFSGDALRGR